MKLTPKLPVKKQSIYKQIVVFDVLTMASMLALEAAARASAARICLALTRSVLQVF